ncbi:Arginine--tRNA ligase [Aerococcus viridans]|nr:Arginine--tRNA ligase [Aerococcus viridans]
MFYFLLRNCAKRPQAIAQEIAPQIEGEIVDRVEAVGPYINFFLNQTLVTQAILTEIYEAGNHFGELAIGHGENITIDMSSPNIAKPMSMGHLRSTVIGECHCQHHNKSWFNPVRINHLGDWGTQFGKLIVVTKNGVLKKLFVKTQFKNC